MGKQVEEAAGTDDDLFALTDDSDQLHGQPFSSGWFDGAKTSSTSNSLTQWSAPQTNGIWSLAQLLASQLKGIWNTSAMALLTTLTVVLLWVLAN